jgi:hypothetical protein
MLTGSARATTTYSVAATFDAAAATAGLTLSSAITFTSDSCSVCATVTDSGITFSASEMNVETVAGWPDGNVLAPPFGDGAIAIAPSTTYYAFALNIITIAGGGYPIDIKFNDGAAEDLEFTTASSDGSGIFVGAISTVPLLNLQIVSDFTNLTFGIDNVQIGSQAATPEGPTNLLIGSGLSGFYWLYRRRRQLLPV